jgi:hypothetical protein
MALRRACTTLLLAFLTLQLACAGPDKDSATAAAEKANAADNDKPFRKSFTPDKRNLANVGRNPYFILEPGYTLHLAHGKNQTLTITVTHQTRTVDGVETRVVEEREQKNGKLVEFSRNYFAIDKATNDLYYFGEDVDEYDKAGKVSHPGSWLSGEQGAKFGLMIPGDPKSGDRFYQELAPEVALDRCEILATDAKMEVPVGKFERCLRCKDTSDLESGASTKVYAPGIGLVKDDDFELVKIEIAGK